MCGRYTLTDPGDLLDVLEVETDDDTPELGARYNIAPTQGVAAVRRIESDDADLDGTRTLRLLHWGLVPFWAKDRAIGNRMINARAETAASKPAFRAAFKRRRCLLLADGFYEWVAQESGPKQPYHIHLPERQPFTFAGLWERWDKDPDVGTIDSCTILTCDASEAMEPYHHRMPVFLEGDARDAWLDPETSPDALQELLRPYAGTLEFTPVSRMVNNPRNEAPGCVEPIERMA
ncbi:MAG: SOS response-associated peptidase [Acidobacteriota bacterium]